MHLCKENNHRSSPSAALMYCPTLIQNDRLGKASVWFEAYSKRNLLDIHTFLGGEMDKIDGWHVTDIVTLKCHVATNKKQVQWPAEKAPLAWLMSNSNCPCMGKNCLNYSPLLLIQCYFFCYCENIKLHPYIHKHVIYILHGIYIQY